MPIRFRSISNYAYSGTGRFNRIKANSCFFIESWIDSYGAMPSVGFVHVLPSSGEAPYESIELSMNKLVFALIRLKRPVPEYA